MLFNFTFGGVSTGGVFIYTPVDSAKYCKTFILNLIRNQLLSV